MSVLTGLRTVRLLGPSYEAASQGKTERRYLWAADFAADLNQNLSRPYNKIEDLRHSSVRVLSEEASTVQMGFKTKKENLGRRRIPLKTPRLLLAAARPWGQDPAGLSPNVVRLGVNAAMQGQAASCIGVQPYGASRPGAPEGVFESFLAVPALEGGGWPDVTGPEPQLPPLALGDGVLRVLLPEKENPQAAAPQPDSLWAFLGGGAPHQEGWVSILGGTPEEPFLRVRREEKPRPGAPRGLPVDLTPQGLEFDGEILNPFAEASYLKARLRIELDPQAAPETPLGRRLRLVLAV